MDMTIPTNLAPAVTNPESTLNRLEGLRIFGKVALSVASVAGTVVAAIAAASIFPTLAVIAINAIGTLPLTASIAIIAGCAFVTALAIFGIERLARKSAAVEMQEAATAEFGVNELESPLELQESVTIDTVTEAVEEAPEAQATTANVSEDLSIGIE